MVIIAQFHIMVYTIIVMNNVYISKNANKIIKDYLVTKGYKIIEVESQADIDPPISCHPDIYMCDLGKSLFHGDTSTLTHDYPGHAIYNGCSTGKFFIHNSKITAPELKKAVLDAGLIPIHVAQGYSKCNCVVVDENSIITSDAGIQKACLNAGLDVLLIEKGQVVLEGYDYGFLGGASGKVGNFILFNGDITLHSDYDKIKSFIEARNLEIVYFDQYPLTDIGSIIEEK